MKQQLDIHSAASRMIYERFDCGKDPSLIYVEFMCNGDDPTIDIVMGHGVPVDRWASFWFVPEPRFPLRMSGLEKILSYEARTGWATFDMKFGVHGYREYEQEVKVQFFENDIAISYSRDFPYYVPPASVSAELCLSRTEWKTILDAIKTRQQQWEENFMNHMKNRHAGSVTT